MTRLAKAPLGVRILIGLLLGVAAGMLLPRPGAGQWSDDIANVAHIAGQLWLSALQMTVLPLVFALLTMGLGGASGISAEGSSIARRSIFVFAALYSLALAVAVVLNFLLLSVWPVSDAAIAAFQKLAGNAVQAQAPNAGDIILTLVPSNIFAALASGSMIPVVVFAILFGLALRHVDEKHRGPIASLIESIASVMFKIVTWVLMLAPLGVFALVLATAHETGLAVIWGLAGYLRHLVTIAAVMLALAYPVAVLWGRIPLVRFASGATSSQLVAVSTQSSVGSLPVMLEASRTLEIGDEVAGVSLPLAVSIFRFSGPALTLSVGAYAASIAGLHIGIAQMVGGAILSLLVEFTAVGLPTQVSFFALYAPVFAAFGAPLGFLPVMLAVETIPDAVGTAANVSMDLAATAVVDRGRRRAATERPGEMQLA